MMHTGTELQIPTIRGANSVVHCAGATAGEIRVNCRVVGEFEADDFVDCLRLEIPGEAGLLRPSDAKRDGVHAAIGFFSADIANAGHVPAAMRLHWKDGVCVHSLGEVEVHSAASIRATHPESAAQVPGGHPMSTYPKTVGSLLVIALGTAVVALGVALIAF